MIVCQKCGIQDNTVKVMFGGYFLGYLCSMHYLDFVRFTADLTFKFEIGMGDSFMNFVSSRENK